MNDKEWEDSLQETDCRRREQLGRFKIMHDVQPDGSWTQWKESTIRMVRRPQVWYLMLADCEGNTHNRYPDLPKIEVEVQAFNDGSHFSQEESYMFGINIFMLASTFLLLGGSLYKYIGEVRADEPFETPLGLLVMAVLAELCMVGFDSLNTLLIYFDGQGLWFLKILTLIWRMGAEFLLVGLFLLIAGGWTLTYRNIFERESYVIVGFGTFALNGMASFMSYLDYGEYHKFHDYSGWPGLVLIVIRLSLYGAFLHLSSTTQESMP